MNLKNLKHVLSLHNLLLIGLALVILAPVFYYGLPWFDNGPDIYYAKAKLLQVQQGNIFADPITGYDTFHPPLFHLILYALMATGLSVNTCLILLTVIYIVFMIFLTYRIIEFTFDKDIALYTTLLISFIFEFMGSRNILLATSFNISIPFFLWGLLLYLKSGDSIKRVIVTSFLWGVAFLFSPVYLFLLIAIAARDYIAYRSIKRLTLAGLTFLITITLFIVQAITVYPQGLQHSRAFSLWHGFPGIKFWNDAILQFFYSNPPYAKTFYGLIAVVIIILALIHIIKSKKCFWVIPAFAIAYFFTFYHFSDQYALRVGLFLSIFVVGYAISFLSGAVKNKTLLNILVFMVTFLSIYNLYNDALKNYRVWTNDLKSQDVIGETFWQNIDRLLNDNEFILTSRGTYFYYVMIYKPIHALGAYKTLDYYQLDSAISDEMEADYVLLTTTTNIDTINNIAQKYNARTAVFSGPDYESSLFQTLAPKWKLAYRDKYISVFKRP